MGSANPVLVARDPAHNLADGEDLQEETTNLQVRLRPALTVASRVTGTDGVPLAHAQAGAWIRVGNGSHQFNELPVKVNSEGWFELRALPSNQRFTVFAKAKDHGSGRQEVPGGSDTNRLELPPFVLRVADAVVAGQVLNSRDKPVYGVNVSLSGEGQPDGYVTTDSKGRFKLKVCAGQVQLFASSQNGFAQATVEAGDTNVMLQLADTSSGPRVAARRLTLTGRPLPDLTACGVASDLLPAGKPVLLCLLDIEQRPSRRAARLLSEQHEALQQKGFTVAAIQTAVISEDTLKEWIESNPVPFPLGRVAAKSAQTRWVSLVETLPWLILADADHRVVAEGFPLDELDTRLKNAAKQP